MEGILIQHTTRRQLWFGALTALVIVLALGIAAPHANVPAALLFYAIYLFGLTWFVLAPALESGSSGKAALGGFLRFGRQPRFDTKPPVSRRVGERLDQFDQAHVTHGAEAASSARPTFVDADS
mgnify:CR=1 FL=1